ncbi:DUF4158 domain-containing protein [Bacillus mycoides]|uniref:DUF4158 domain-containing protein n=1 Tax=Bacillus mycoides TaxID=1405 RepID=UPI003D6601B0
MPSIQDTIYPRMKNNVTSQELANVYTPNRKEFEWTATKSRGNIQQLGLLVLLKTVQKLGRFPKLLDVPQIIIEHIAKTSYLPIPDLPEWQSYCESRTCERHYRFVRDYLQIKPFNEQARHILLDTMTHLAGMKDDTADLINAAIEELIHCCYELPIYTTLKDAANKVRRKSYRKIYKHIYSALNESQKNKINQVFQSSENYTYSTWNRLKEDSKRATLSHLKDLISYRNWLVNQNIPIDITRDIPLVKVKQMAIEAKTLTAGRMAEMEPQKRYSLAICLVRVQLSKDLDNIGEMLIKRIMSIHKRGRNHLQDYKKKTQKRTDSLVATLHDVILAYQTEGVAKYRLEAIQQVIGSQEDQVLQDCEDHLAFSGDNYYLFLWRFFKSHRSTLFKILESISLYSTHHDKSIEQAITFLLSHQHTRKEWISVVDLVKKNWNIN